VIHVLPDFVVYTEQEVEEAALEMRGAREKPGSLSLLRRNTRAGSKRFGASWQGKI